MEKKYICFLSIYQKHTKRIDYKIMGDTRMHTNQPYTHKGGSRPIRQLHIKSENWQKAFTRFPSR